jgi:hypothetical protein
MKLGFEVGFTVDEELLEINGATVWICVKLTVVGDGVAI